MIQIHVTYWGNVEKNYGIGCGYLLSMEGSALQCPPLSDKNPEYVRHTSDILYILSVL